MSESPSNPASSDSEQVDSAGYVVVARRYRPRSFEELVGQQHVGQALKNAIETNRVGHAYLFTGARGVGKTSMARIFAKSLNSCDGPTASPDQDSEISQAIDSGEDVDVIEIDGASNRGIDEIRSLRANIGVRPSRSRYKIYIIDEVHMLTTPAFNALLKTLEEPPEHVKFIFCTTDPEKIPITVLSRCQRFDFAPVELQEIITRLRYIIENENSEADEDALELIARRAAGSMRDSQSLLEQVLSFSSGKLTADQVHTMLGTANDERLHSLAEALASRDSALALRQVDAAIDQGVDAGRLAEQLLGYFRDLMAVSVGCDASMLRHTSASMHQSLHALGQQWGLQTVLAVVGLVDQTLVRSRHSLHARVLLEASLIQICNLPDLQQIADLAAASESFEGAPKVGEKKKGESQLSAVTSKSNPASAQTRTVQFGSEDNNESKNSPEQGSRAIQPSVDSPTQPKTPPRSDNHNISQASESGSNPGSTDSSVPSSQRNDSPSDPQKQTATASSNGDPWTQHQAETAWQETLKNLESMTESFARMVEKIEVTGPASLKLYLPFDGTLAKRRFDTPEHRDAIASQLSSAAGRKIRLEVDLLAQPRQRPEPPTSNSKPSRMQRMREIENNPLVKECLELFEAEIAKIDKAR